MDSVTAMAEFGLTSTSENLQGAIDGEVLNTQMYPAYIAGRDAEEKKLLAMKYAMKLKRSMLNYLQRLRKQLTLQGFRSRTSFTMPNLRIYFNNRKEDACHYVTLRRVI